MDDSLAEGAWHIDPQMRDQLRLGRVRTAAERCSWSEVILEAEELLDDHPDHPEALALLGEALLEIGDYEIAKLALEHRVSMDGSDPAALSGLALASFHAVDLPAAAAAAREAIRLDASDARAHHVLGLVLERSGHATEATSSLAAAAALDPTRYPLPIVVAPAEWGPIISRAVAGLPTKLQLFFNGLSVRIEELPSFDDLRAAAPPLPPTLGALFVGDPPDDGDPFEIRPQAIRLFARNLGLAGSVEGLVQDLGHALQEAALDWLGVELDALEEEPSSEAS